MRVPQYDKPQAELGPLNNAATTLPTAAAFGASAVNTAALGKGLTDLGGSVDKIMQQQAQTEAFDAEAKLKTDWLAYAGQLQKTRQGAGAKGVTEDVGKWWDENAPKAAAAATNGLSQRMLQQATSRLRLAGMGEFQHFELQQGMIAADAAVEANVKGSISLIAASPNNPQVLAEQRGAITQQLTMHGALRNWAPEVLNDKVATAQSAASIAAFNTLMARSATEARDWWAQNRETVRPEMRDEIESRLKTAVATQVGGAAAREVFTAATAGKPYTAAIMADEMDAALVKQLGDKPEELHAARLELDRQVGLRNKVQTERTGEATEGVMAVWNKTKSIAAVKASEAWSQLPATQQARVDEHFAAVQTTEIQRQQAMAGRDLIRLQRIEHEQRIRYAPAMVMLSQPEVIAQMTPAAIMAEMPTIGAENVEKLLKARAAFQGNQAKLSEAKVDNDMLNAALTLGGIDPRPSHTDKEGAYKVWAVRDEVERRIGARQQAKGKDLTSEEKREVMQQVVGEKVLTPTWYSVGNAGRDESVAAALKPEQLGKANVPINYADGSSQHIPISAIPTAEYQATERFLRERGQPSGPQAVAQRWAVEKYKAGKK